MLDATSLYRVELISKLAADQAAATVSRLPKQPKVLVPESLASLAAVSANGALPSANQG